MRLDFRKRTKSEQPLSLEILYKITIFNPKKRDWEVLFNSLSEKDAIEVIRGLVKEGKDFRTIPYYKGRQPRG